MTPEQFDLVVIGAGPAGVSAAAQAAYFGKTVCLIEKAPKPGGAAVNTATIPSKTLRETALYFSGLRQRALFGLDLRVKPDIAIGDFMQRERPAIEGEWNRIHEGIERQGITTIQGAATFTDAGTVEVTRYGQPARLVAARVFLVATGSSPQPPSTGVVDDEVIVDSESVLTLQKIPTSMVVVGGGVVGCEFACMFGALGVRVTIVNARSRLLAHMEAEVSDALRQAMTARLGITVLCDVDIAAVEVDAGRAHVTMTDERTISTDVVLVCSGRVGNSRDMGLEPLGVQSDARGFLKVDTHHRTSAPHIYAAGDVTGFPVLASVSIEQARAAVCHAFDQKYKGESPDAMPYGVWTIPEIATVGESEDALLAREVPFEVGRASFRNTPRGQILGDTDGFLKLVFHREDQRLLGVTIVGEGACEMIHVGMTAIAFGATIDYFVQAAFTYPSLHDTYKQAAHDGLQRLQRRHARIPGLPALRDVETSTG